MTKAFVSVLAIVSSAFLLSTPALATKGIDAARKCEATPLCVVLYDDDGSIVIQTGNGHTIECPGPQADCKVLGIRPTSSGATNSAVGTPAKR